jgi:hypothetical protein
MCEPWYLYGICFVDMYCEYVGAFEQEQQRQEEGHNNWLCLRGCRSDSRGESWLQLPGENPPQQLPKLSWTNEGGRVTELETEGVRQSALTCQPRTDLSFLSTRIWGWKRRGCVTYRRLSRRWRVWRMASVATSLFRASGVAR